MQEPLIPEAKNQDKYSKRIHLVFYETAENQFDTCCGYNPFREYLRAKKKKHPNNTEIIYVDPKDFERVNEGQLGYWQITQNARDKYRALEETDERTKITLHAHGTPEAPVLLSASGYGFELAKVCSLFKLISNPKVRMQKTASPPPEGPYLKISLTVCHGTIFAEAFIRDLSKELDYLRGTITAVGPTHISCALPNGKKNIYRSLFSANFFRTASGIRILAKTGLTLYAAISLGMNPTQSFLASPAWLAWGSFTIIELIFGIFFACKYASSNKAYKTVWHFDPDKNQVVSTSKTDFLTQYPSGFFTPKQDCKTEPVRAHSAATFSTHSSASR